MITAMVWLSFAFALGLVMRLVGLPPLVGYLAAGFLLSAFGYEGNTLLDTVAHAGVLLLLFSVGLKLRLKSLIRGEVLGGTLLHMLLLVPLLVVVLGLASGLARGSILMVAVVLSFSSTVVAAKVLESKRELRAFHGRVAIGVLIIQDLIAVAILSLVGGATPSPWAFLLVGFFLLRPLIHGLLDLSGHGELVVLYGLILALVIGGSSFEQFGLSPELGALLLGVILSDHRRSVELSDSLWSLKEVLLVGFFLQIGLSGHPSLETFEQALWLNLLLPLKAALFFLIFLAFRLRARSSFLAALSLASYSEFGLIVANLGVRNGWLSHDWLVLLAVTVALSFAISAPLNRYAHELYRSLERTLRRFESSRRHPDDEPVNIGKTQIVVAGMGRVGTGVYDTISTERRVIGLDSDPGKIENHRKQGRRVVYADAEDPELWSNLNLDSVQAVLLAMPDTLGKILATKQLRKSGYHGFIATTAVFADEVDSLKKAGADIVYNYYEGIGFNFAKQSLAQLEATPKAPVSSD